VSFLGAGWGGGPGEKQTRLGEGDLPSSRLVFAAISGSPAASDGGGDPGTGFDSGRELGDTSRIAHARFMGSVHGKVGGAR
jgi:hypothetical protein